MAISWTRHEPHTSVIITFRVGDTAFSCDSDGSSYKIIIFMKLQELRQRLANLILVFNP
jgi:hypothetical protein